MVENGVKIISLTEILTMADSLYFPVTDASGTYRVSWETMLSSILGDYELWPHDIPDTTKEIVTLRNTDATKEFTIFEIRSPNAGAILEATLSLHLNSDIFSEDHVRDLSYLNYDDDLRAVDVLSNFTGTVRSRWMWVTNALVGATLTEAIHMTLNGANGCLGLNDATPTARLDILINGAETIPGLRIVVDSTGVPQAIIARNAENYAQTADLVLFELLNATDSGDVLQINNAGTGYGINCNSKIKAASFVANDGSAGVSGTFTSGTLTVKNGIITAIA